MTDQLREALDQIGGPAGRSWRGDHYLVRHEVVDAARKWLAVTALLNSDRDEDEIVAEVAELAVSDD